MIVETWSNGVDHLLEDTVRRLDFAVKRLTEIEDRLDQLEQLEKLPGVILALEDRIVKLEARSA